MLKNKLIELPVESILKLEKDTHGWNQREIVYPYLSTARAFSY